MSFRRIDTLSLRQHSRKIFLRLAIFTAAWITSDFGFAQESARAYPGTRAMGMAGVFTAQADDASAIWYNPAGPKHYPGIARDMSVEVGTLPLVSLVPNALRGEQQDLAGITRVKFIAAYWNGLPQTELTRRTGFGIAYVEPYANELFVDEARTAVDATPFGNVELTYHQVSGQLARTVTPTLSLGVTGDFLWTDAQCLQFSPCVENGPAGFGVSAGALFEVAHSERRTVNVGLMFRSRASLNYKSLPESGLGTVLEAYVPDRPASVSLGVNVQAPATWAALKVNVDVEHIAWGSAAEYRLYLTDYTAVGISGEAIIARDEGVSVALRSGLRAAIPRTDAGPDVTGISIGAGYGFSRRHMLDVALEARKSGGQQVMLWSLSYSLQY